MTGGQKGDCLRALGRNGERLSRWAGLVQVGAGPSRDTGPCGGFLGIQSQQCSAQASPGGIVGQALAVGLVTSLLEPLALRLGPPRDQASLYPFLSQGW